MADIQRQLNRLGHLHCLGLSLPATVRALSAKCVCVCVCVRTEGQYGFTETSLTVNQSFRFHNSSCCVCVCARVGRVFAFAARQQAGAEGGHHLAYQHQNPSCRLIPLRCSVQNLLGPAPERPFNCSLNLPQVPPTSTNLPPSTGGE